VPTSVVDFTGVVDELTMLNQVMIAAAPISHAQMSAEEEVVEFRLLPPRVESIASFRNKVKFGKAAADFAKSVRSHTFRVEEDLEEQSE